MPRFEKCHFCGEATRSVAGPGRWQMYRGVRCELPADLAIDTCTVCGREWLADADIAVMSASLERQRLAASAPHVRDAELVMGMVVVGAIMGLAAAVVGLGASSPSRWRLVVNTDTNEVHHAGFLRLAKSEPKTAPPHPAASEAQNTNFIPLVAR